MVNLPIEDKRKKEIRRTKKFADDIDEKSNKFHADGYGLCSSCSRMSYRELEHGHRTIAWCNTYDDRNGNRRLSNVHRITRCSDYSDRGVLSIDTMWVIATLIDVMPKKVVGFVRENVVTTDQLKDNVTENDIAFLDFEEDD
jgi:hypothetical protein